MRLLLQSTEIFRLETTEFLTELAHSDMRLLLQNLEILCLLPADLCLICSSSLLSFLSGSLSRSLMTSAICTWELLEYIFWVTSDENPRFINLFSTTRPWRLNISTFGYLMKNAFPKPDVGGAARVAPDLPTESPFSVTAYVADTWAHYTGDIGWIEKQGQGACTLDISTGPCRRWIREASWSKIPAWLRSERSQLRYRERRLRRESHRAGRMIRSDETLHQNVRDFSGQKCTRSDYWHDPICSSIFDALGFRCWIIGLWISLRRDDFIRLLIWLHGCLSLKRGQESSLQLISLRK